ncbi:ParA family protein [Bacteriovorax sp. DB6_IX]|uniref:ParA family protein n=1 Tax=Bacteriovorax sp. DB6_IX TaxID=1353530 RepID=UPI000389F688|nr:ParA family protein [Bacteriovorax sp. DB6_IX]EQC50886.1 CobQ/CobB/MinD/ParA nucleotide binding domain protein [Bacteriovorax sp. DB6_IX]
MFFKKVTKNIETPRGKVIPFLNQKGGVGKTTMCFNSAHALAQKGKRVLCIDMDPQANLSLLFGVDTSETDQYSIHQLLVNSVRELKSLHSVCLVDDVIVEGEVDIIPAGQELSGFELTMAAISSPRQLILKKFLEKNDLLNRYDYILLDCPPTLGLLVVNAICAGHGVIVPFRPDDFSKKGLNHFYDMLEDVQDMGIVDVPEILAHVPNLVDNRRKVEEQDLHEIKEMIGERLGEDRVVNPFYNRAQLVKSQASKKSVFDYSSKEYSHLHQQFHEIADIIETWNAN